MPRFSERPQSNRGINPLLQHGDTPNPVLGDRLRRLRREISEFSGKSKGPEQGTGC